MAMISGLGRVDMQCAVDDAGELYILTKSDGMIKKVVGAEGATGPTTAVNVPAPSPAHTGTGQPATTSLRNPVAPTSAPIAAGRRAYDASCAACHGPLAQGPSKPVARRQLGDLRQI